MNDIRESIPLASGTGHSRREFADRLTQIFPKHGVVLVPARECNNSDLIRQQILEKKTVKRGDQLAAGNNAPRPLHDDFPSPLKPDTPISTRTFITHSFS